MNVRYFLGGVLRRGYTVVELMITICIVSILVSTICTYFVKLLTLQENEREEAYIKEKLSDICANFSDYISIGTNIDNRLSDFVVSYRYETGGVSFETGRVSRVSGLTASLNPSSSVDQPVTMDLDVATFEQGTVNEKKFSRNFRGDDMSLISLNDIKELKITNKGRVDLRFQLTKLNMSASLWNLRLVADYEVEDDDDPKRTVTAERIVRLWNRD